MFLVCAFCQNFETRTLLGMQLVAFSEDVRPTAMKRPDFHHRGVMASSFFIFQMSVHRVVFRFPRNGARAS